MTTPVTYYNNASTIFNSSCDNYDNAFKVHKEFESKTEGLFDIEHNPDYKMIANDKPLLNKYEPVDVYVCKNEYGYFDQSRKYATKTESDGSKTVSVVYESAGTFGESVVGEVYEFSSDGQNCTYTNVFNQTEIEINHNGTEDFQIREQNPAGTNLCEYKYDAQGNLLSQNQKTYVGNILQENNIQYNGRSRIEIATTKVTDADVEPKSSMEDNDSTYILQYMSKVEYDYDLITYEYCDTDGNGTLDNVTDYKYYTDAELGKMEEADHRDSLNPEEEYISKKWSIDGYNYEYYEFGNAPQKNYLEVSYMSSDNKLTTWIDRKCNDGGAKPNNKEDIERNKSYYDEIIVMGKDGEKEHEYTIFP